MSKFTIKNGRIMLAMEAANIPKAPTPERAVALEAVGMATTTAAEAIKRYSQKKGAQK